MDQPYHISLGHFLSFFAMISGRMKFLIFNIPLPNPDSQVSPEPRSSKLAGEDEIRALTDMTGTLHALHFCC